MKVVSGVFLVESRILLRIHTFPSGILRARYEFPCASSTVSTSCRAWTLDQAEVSTPPLAVPPLSWARIRKPMPTEVSNLAETCSVPVLSMFKDVR